jgi:hypothetical protein
MVMNGRVEARDGEGARGRAARRRRGRGPKQGGAGVSLTRWRRVSLSRAGWGQASIRSRHWGGAKRVKETVVEPGHGMEKQREAGRVVRA